MKIKNWLLEIDGAEIKKFFLDIRNRLRNDTFSTYFRTVSMKDMHICIFQLNIRHPLPIMDLLYLEYLNQLMQEGQILKLVIFSSEDRNFPKQQVDVWEKHRENIDGIFAERTHDVTIIDVEEVLSDLKASDLMSEEFMELIHYVSNDFLQKSASDSLKLKVTHFSEFNRYYPDNDRLESLYQHLAKGYVIWRYLFSHGMIPSQRVVVGQLAWETAIAKWGVYDKMVASKQKCAILGKTVRKNEWQPIPNFDQSESIYLYEDHQTTVAKLNTKARCELKQYVRILKTILRENYSHVSEAEVRDVGINRAPSVVKPKSQTVHDIINYMDILRSIYEGNRERIQIEGLRNSEAGRG